MAGRESDSGCRRDCPHWPPSDIGPAPVGPVAHLTGSQAQTGWGPDTPGRLSYQSSPWWRDALPAQFSLTFPPPSTQCHRALTRAHAGPIPIYAIQAGSRGRCMGSQHRRGTLQTHTHIELRSVRGPCLTQAQQLWGAPDVPPWGQPESGWPSCALNEPDEGACRRVGAWEEQG